MCSQLGDQVGRVLLLLVEILPSGRPKERTDTEGTPKMSQRFLYKHAWFCGIEQRAGHEVVIGGTLYSDSMGAPGTWEGTYEGMIEPNVNLMSAALGGSVPEAGCRGAKSGANEGT